MSDQDHPAWPTADDETPPGRRGTRPDESTKRIQFPLVDPDSTRQRPTPPAGLPLPPRTHTPPAGLPLRPATPASGFPVPPPRPEQKTTPLQKPGYPPPEPPRAAPMRIEPAAPPPPDAAQEQPPPKRKRRTGLIIAAAIVLVVALGAGVVFFVPGVKERLGLGPTEPEVVIQPPPSPIAFTPSLRGPSADAPTPSTQGVQSTLAGPAGAAALGTLTGVVLDPATGNALWDKNSATTLVPASTIKVLTAAAALLKIDHGQQFSTKVVAGKDPGSVIIVGGGDTTLSALPVGKESVHPGAAHLDDLVAQVKASGVKVTQVYLDRTRYTGDDVAPGVLPGDVAEGYIAPMTSLMLDGGRADGTKDKSPRSPNPPRALATEFAKRIGATMAAKPEVTAPPDAKVLGEVKSAPLTELVDNALLASDNTLAETLARETAKAAGEEASFAGWSKAVVKVLQENGFDTAGAQIIDGSGMSTNDKVSAKLLASVLAVAAGPDGKDPRTAKLRPLLGGLPVAGGSGTLAGRFAPGLPSAQGRGWVRAKTGTLPMAGVNTLAGMVLDADGRVLVFALMTSGSDTNAARPALDAVAAALRTCGCK